MNNHVIAICILLVALAAILAFIAGAVFALRYQRRLMRRTGYVQIGSDLYRAELVAAPVPYAKRVSENKVVVGGRAPQTANS